jgi:PLP dependent protein
VSDARAEEVARNLAEVRERIAKAAHAAGRDPGELTLVGITKTFPVQDAAVLLELGVRDLGESRDQEARVKARELPVARWHFVGRLQRNKARSVVTYADVVESVDSIRLAQALDGAAQRQRDRLLDVLIQISLDGDASRGGVVESELSEVAEAVAASAGLRLRGVMAVAPLGGNPDTAFEKLAGLSSRLTADHPGADVISAGMSGDLEQAVRHGATHVRIGTSLLGRRNPLR